MFYINKKDKNEVVELIYSDLDLVVVIDQEDSLMKGNPIGRIIKKNKKQFKKDYEKAPTKVVKIDAVSENEKQEILNIILNDKHGILNYTKEYIEQQNFLERQDYFSELNDSDYKKSLKSFADPFIQKKKIKRKELLRVKESLMRME